jgi:tetratricopeptide (TPR) repeat protein
MIFRRDLGPVAGLLLGLAILGGCGEAAPELSPLDAARAQLARGDPLAARVFLERALEQGTPREDVAALLGEAALVAGDLPTARKWLGPGKFSEDTRAIGFRLLGRLEMAQGNLPGAGAAFDQSYRVEPHSSDLWVDIGRLRYRGGEQVQAIEAADRALTLDPDNGEALQFRGQLARDAEGMEAGAALLAKALERRPDDLELRVEYAATLGDAGRATKALEALRAAGGHAAVTPRGLFVQAVIAARGNDFRLARGLLEKSDLERSGVASAQLLSAIIDLAEENYASAALTLDRLYSRQPDNRRVRDLLAYALLRSGGERELVHRFADAAGGRAASAYLQLLVGRACETLGDRRRAAFFLDLAALDGTGLTVLPSRSPQAAPAASTSLGGVQLRDYVRAAIAGRETAAAVKRARAFAQRFPGSADAQALLGDAEFAQGNKVAARAAYERSSRVRRPWPLALRLAGVQDDPARARQMLAHYVRNNPLNGEAAAVLADAVAAQGEWNRAAQLLDHAMVLGQARVPWVLAARSIAALQLDDREDALDYALAAHELQPMNPLAISALLAALPDTEAAAKAELEAKLQSLTAG